MNLCKKFLFVAAIVLFCSAVQAADGEWEYVVAPYFLGAGMDGTVGVLGREAELDVSFSDILKNLEFGFMGHIEATNGQWVVLGDIMYVGLGADTTNVVSDTNQWIIDGGVGRRFGKNFELLGGGRIVRLDQKLRFRGPLEVQLEADKTWFDPYVGGRIIGPLSDKVTVFVRGDIGGFGIGSEIAWYLNPAVAINITERGSLVFFYRFQSFDYENEDDGFLFDVMISGPGAGFAFRF